MLFSVMGESPDQGGSKAAVGSILTPVEGLKVIRRGDSTAQAVKGGAAVFLGDTIVNDSTDDVWIGLNDGSAIQLASSHRFTIDHAICDANG